MKRKQRISVVIPCYNDGRYLPETLDCLASQTRKVDEVLVVNDGSTDPDTLALLGRLPPAIRVLHQENQGLGFARNNGIKLLTGDLVLILDSDDLIAPDTLEKMEAALEANPDASWVYTQIESFGAWQDIVPVPRWNPYLQLDNNYCVVMSLVRRSVYSELGLLYPRMRGYEDWSFWMSCIEAGLKGVVIDEPLFKYRRKLTGSLLTSSDRVRHELRTELMQQHPALFTREARAALKSAHAPGLEVLWTGPAADAPAVRAFLDRQTLSDVVLTTDFPADARGLLRAIKGKYVVAFGPAHLPLLERCSPTFLEQLLRASETRNTPAIVVPTDAPTLVEHTARSRVCTYPVERLDRGLADLCFLRTFYASNLTTADLSADSEAAALFHKVLREQGGLLFAHDFFFQVKELPAKSALPSASALQRAPDETKSLRMAVSLARKGIVRVLGEDETARLLHPIKVGLRDQKQRLQRMIPTILGPRPQKPLPPSREPRLLCPSQFEERRILNGIGVAFERHAPVATQGSGRRVLMMLPWVNCGGVDKAAVDQAALLKSAGYEVSLATNITSGNEWAHKFNAHVSDVWHMDYSVPTVEQVGVVAELVRTRGIDAVYMCHSWLGYQSAEALKRRLPGVKTVDYLHMNSAYMKESYRYFDRFLDMHMTSSEYLIEKAVKAGVSRSKLRLIRTACDEEGLFNPARVSEGWLYERLRLRRGTPLVGFVGRLHADKNPLFLSRLHARIRSRWSQPNRPLHFVFIGSGPEEERLQALVTEQGMHHFTHFLPSDTPIALAMRDMSLLLLASKIEGLPLVFFEAMAMGVPVVSTSIQGIPELVTSEVGACVPNLKDPERRMERLSDAALRILENDELRAAMGRRARLRLQGGGFSLAEANAAYLQAFEELLRGSADAAGTLELVKVG
ncbi:glycosyltransferase [Pyxidicoccus trucidator]|uniref:glycosyltransferase n=1 Tax=Pyxidicoccus trucidator TaxID=2709662 RepID=UPI0013DC1822|nr:glycosyltransferase [Pyxidicoccus trucidator]